MKKKALSIILAACLCLGLWAVPAGAVYDVFYSEPITDVIYSDDSYSGGYTVGANLLTNPSFEYGLDGWTDSGGMWDTVSSESGYYPQDGSYFAWAKHSYREDSCIWQDVSLAGYAPGNTVYFHVDETNYDQSPHDMARIELTFAAADGRILESYVHEQRNPYWTTQSIVAAIPSEAATVRVTLWAVWFVGGDVDAYYDNAYLGITSESVAPVTITAPGGKETAKAGEVFTLTASNGSTTDPGRFTWSSSYDNDATVDNYGNVTMHTDAPNGVAIYARDNVTGAVGVYWINSKNSNKQGQGSGAAADPGEEDGKYMTRTFDAGSGTAAAIDTNGDLWVWGSDEYYMMGNGIDRRDSSSPVKLMEHVASVALGSYHGAALRVDGSVWTWGWNRYGQLGITYSTAEAPIRVMDDVVFISCGGERTAAIKSDGSLWMWGSDGDGALGNGEEKGNSCIPQKIMDNVACVSCGGSFTAAVTEDGELWTWGCNFFGQLGNGEQTHSNDSQIPIKVMDGIASVDCGAYRIAAKGVDGSLYVWGANILNKDATRPQKMAEHVSGYSCYDQVGEIINGQLVMWGSNSNGQLGNGTDSFVGNTRGDGTVSPISFGVTDVRCGDNFTMARKSDGSLWAWGSDRSGQLGQGTVDPSWDNKSFSPLQVPGLTVAASAPFVRTALPGSMGMSLLRESQTLSAGHGWFAAIKPDNSLWVWGSDEWSQLGNGQGRKDSSAPMKLMDDVTFVSCGSLFGGAIKSDGSLWMWGRNNAGQVGVEDKYANTESPAKVLDNVVFLSCGGEHAAAIKADGSLWMWGNDGSGQMGNGPDQGGSRVPVKIMDSVAYVSCGGDHTAVVKTDGSLWTFGCNYWGQLGNGLETHANDSQSPIKVMDNVAKAECGAYTTTIITNDGSVWVLGNAEGNSTTTVPGKVMGKAVAASAGYPAAVLDADGAVHVWGSTDVVTGNGGQAQGVDVLAAKTGFTEIAVGQYAMAGRKADGTLWTWGSDRYGELGIGTVDPTWDNKSGTPVQVPGFIVKAPGGTSYANNVTVNVDGTPTTFPMYALVTPGGGQTNFIKVRDLAYILNSTQAKFNVNWSAERGMYLESRTAYKATGTEMNTPFSGARGYTKLTDFTDIDGVLTPLNTIQLKDDAGNGYTYCELRGLGKALGFNVGWSMEKGIFIETDKPYQG